MVGVVAATARARQRLHARGILGGELAEHQPFRPQRRQAGRRKTAPQRARSPWATWKMESQVRRWNGAGGAAGKPSHTSSPGT